MTVEIYRDSNGSLFDDLFEPRQTGDPAVAATEFLDSAGADISTLYAPIAVGSGLGSNTGFVRQSDGLDMAAVFCSRGTRGGILSITLPAAKNATCASSSTSCTAQTTITAAGVGGTAPHTYAWTVVSGTGIIVSGAASATVSVSESTSGAVQTVYQCTVTDSVAATSSGQCTVTFDYSYADNLAVSVPSNVGGSCTTSGGSCTASVTIAATVTGGIAPEAYTWSVVAGGVSIVAGQGTTSISVSQSVSGPVNTSAVQCTVTDATGFIVTSSNCIVTLGYAYQSNLAVSVPATASGGCSSSSVCTASTTVKATPTSGIAPYAYAWSAVSGAATIINATSQTCTVSASISATATAVIKCTVTDSYGTVVVSGDCTVTLGYTYLDNLVATIPTTAASSCTTSGTLCTASTAISVSVTGGRGPYTYTWDVISGGAGVSGGQGTSTATISKAVGSGGATAVVNCLVKDYLGFLVTSNNCTLTFSYIYNSGGSGGGGVCVCPEMWLLPNVQAMAAVEGDLAECLVYPSMREDGVHPEELTRVPMSAHHGTEINKRVLLVTQNGCECVLSVDTPINLITATHDMDPGHYVFAEDALGHEIETAIDAPWRYAARRASARVLPAFCSRWVVRLLRPRVRPSRVVHVGSLGAGPVLYLSYGGASYAAGVTPWKRIVSHNMAKSLK